MEGHQFRGVAIKDEPLDTGDYGHVTTENQSENQESSSIAVRKSRRQSAMVSQFENKSRPKRQLSGRILELDELLLLTGKQLVQLFSEVTANSLNKSFEYSCCMIPETCSTTYKSFGNEDKARNSIMNHLGKHIEELLEKKKGNRAFKFTAQTVSNVPLKSVSTVKKRGRSMLGKSRRRDDDDEVIPGNITSRPSESSDVVIKIENVKTEPVDHNEYEMPMDQIPTLEIVDLRCVKIEQDQILAVGCEPVQVSEQGGVTKEKENIAPKRKVRKGKTPTNPSNENFEAATTVSHSKKTPDLEVVGTLSNLNIEKEIIYLDKTDISHEVDVGDSFNELCIYEEADSTDWIGRKRRYEDDDDEDADKWRIETAVLRSCGKSRKNSRNNPSIITPELYDKNVVPDQSEENLNQPSKPERIHHCNSSCVDHMYHKRFGVSNGSEQDRTNLQSEDIQECEMPLEEDDAACLERPNLKPQKMLLTILPHVCPSRLVVPMIRVSTADIDLALLHNDPYEEILDDEEVPVSIKFTEKPSTQAGPDEMSIEMISDEKANEIAETNANEWSQKDMQEMVMYYIGQIKSRKVMNSLVCKICKKRFTATATLVHHYKSHAGLKSFPCPLCDAQLTRQHSLNYHMSIHENRTRFTCSTCGRGFRHPSHYKEHLRKHTGETPFHCPDCGSKFKTSNTFKRHMKTQHNKKVPPVRPNRVQLSASDGASEGQDCEAQTSGNNLAQDTSNSSSNSISPFQPVSLLLPPSETNSAKAEDEVLDLRVQSRKIIDDEAGLMVLPRPIAIFSGSKSLLHPRFLKRLQTGTDEQNVDNNTR